MGASGRRSARWWRACERREFHPRATPPRSQSPSTQRPVCPALTTHRGRERQRYRERERRIELKKHVNLMWKRSLVWKFGLGGNWGIVVGEPEESDSTWCLSEWAQTNAAAKSSWTGFACAGSHSWGFHHLSCCCVLQKWKERREDNNSIDETTSNLNTDNNQSRRKKQSKTQKTNTETDRTQMRTASPPTGCLVVISALKIERSGWRGLT